MEHILYYVLSCLLNIAIYTSYESFLGKDKAVLLNLSRVCVDNKKLFKIENVFLYLFISLSLYLNN